MKTAIRTKSNKFYFFMVAFALMTITLMCLGVLSVRAMNPTESSEFMVWLNGRGEMNKMTKSLAMGFFRIDTKFYDGLTHEKIEKFKTAKDKFMRKAVSITEDKYGRYTDKKQAKEKNRRIKYKGIGVHIGVPRDIHDKRKAHFKEVIIGAVPGLNLTVEDFKSEDLFTIELINSIVVRLEKNSSEFKKFRENYKKGFLDENGMEIIKVIVGGPAYKAGVKDGWRITHIDGKSSMGLFMDEFVDLILKGRKRSVVLTLAPPLAESEKETMDIKIKKGVVRSTWLTDEIIEKEFGQIGIITFNQFDFSGQERKLNAKMFEDALIANKKSAGIIIDLRDNRGGMLVEADIVLERLLPNGRSEIILDYRGEKRKVVSTSARIKRLWNGGPIVFITNRHSASASELVAGSMREQLPDLVKLVGTPTFGKGSIQARYIDFPDGTELSITGGRFKMPISEKTFEEEPLQPDVLMEDDKATHEDEQLEKAIEVLGKLILLNDKRKALAKSMVFE